MKRLLVIAIALSLLTACSVPAQTSPTPNSVTLTLVSMFGGGDANAATLKSAVAAYMDSSGNKVQNLSSIGDDTWKIAVINDFAEGNEPDVLQFFSGNTSDPIVEKLVTIDEIREVYPDYLTNLSEDVITSAAAGTLGQKRCWGPSNGYWEQTFVNSDVLKRAGIAEPPQTWDDFLAACEKIKAIGVTPIGVDFASEPNYLFEFLLYNYAGDDLPLQTPRSSGDLAASNISAALKDFKLLNDKGFFSAEAANATREQTVAEFAAKKSAFLCGGHWNVAAIQSASLDAASVLGFGFPTKDPSVRSAGSVISGYSSGFAITRKAWDDPSKREAAVKLVEAILTDENVSAFANGGLTAVPSKAGAIVSGDVSSFLQSCLDVNKNADLTTAPAEDFWSANTGKLLFNNLIARVCNGTTTVDQAIEELVHTVTAADK
ncbi:hypothetical protein FACS1894208_03740 [Clostridia bacterium]|nr:hypothetical protein FACS1894208_03740 [Clostridia bacterium]